MCTSPEQTNIFLNRFSFSSRGYGELFLGVHLVCYIAILHLPNAAAYGAKLPTYPKEYFQHKQPSINILCKSYPSALRMRGKI